MKEEITLEDLFKAKKDELKKQLEGLSVPKDFDLIKERIEKTLDSLFSSKGEYRQKLTQSEDYVLQAALNLLNAEQQLQLKYIELFQSVNQSQKQSTNTSSAKEKEKSPYFSLLGTAVGAGVGAFIGTWGAAFGALGGTAMAIYLMGNKVASELKATPNDGCSAKLDADSFLSILESICTQVDSLMKTVRAQMTRIHDEYKSKAPDSLFTLYPAFVAQLESLFEIVSEGEPSGETTLIQIDLLKRSLKNYGIAVVDGKLIQEY